MYNVVAMGLIYNAPCSVIVKTAFAYIVHCNIILILEKNAANNCNLSDIQLRIDSISFYNQGANPVLDGPFDLVLQERPTGHMSHPH